MMVSNEGAFSKGIAQAREQSSANREKEFVDHLRKHGPFSLNDLGTVLALKEQFQISGAAFDRIVGASHKNR